MLEVRGRVPHDDRPRHLDIRQHVALDRHRVAHRSPCVEGHVHQRGGGELDRRKACIERPRRQHLLQQSLRHRLSGLEVDGIFLEDLRYRQPVLVELRGKFHEIARDAGARHRGIGDVRQHAVQCVPELVEQRSCIIERQQCRLACSRLGEVADVVDDRQFALCPALQRQLVLGLERTHPRP